MKSIKSGREAGESKLKAIIRYSFNPGEPKIIFTNIAKCVSKYGSISKKSIMESYFNCYLDIT